MAPTCIKDLATCKFWLSILAEFLGTLLLVLFACGSCYSTESSHLHIALSFGLSVGTIVWAIAHISGGHINPAVTLGFLVTRKISILKAIFYILAQSVGAIVGAFVLKMVSPSGVNDKLGTTVPSDGVSDLMAFVVEGAVTFLLVFVVFATCDGRRQGFGGSGPLAIGLSITVGHLFGIKLSGAGTNPARSFGPAVVAGIWTSHWVYWVAPILGGVLAGLIYDTTFAVNASGAKIRALFTRSDYDDAKYDAPVSPRRSANEISEKV